MMEQELTEWFPTHIKPVMIGVYVTRRTSHTSEFQWYAKWDGKNWLMDAQTAELAGKRVEISYFQYRVWRGLKRTIGANAMSKCQWRCDHCDMLMDEIRCCCTPNVVQDAKRMAELNQLLRQPQWHIESILKFHRELREIEDRVITEWGNR